VADLDKDLDSHAIIDLRNWYTARKSPVDAERIIVLPSIHQCVMVEKGRFARRAWAYFGYDP